MQQVDVQYYSHDFYFEDLVKEIEELQLTSALPAITPYTANIGGDNNFNSDSKGAIIITEDSRDAATLCCSKSDENYSNNWDKFFLESGKSGSFFKPRRYLEKEFFKYLNNEAVKKVLEVGCGHGCSMYPLLEKFHHFDFIATDYSGEALSILRSNEKFASMKHRVVTELWDFRLDRGSNRDCDQNQNDFVGKNSDSDSDSNSKIGSNDQMDINGDKSTKSGDFTLLEPDLILCVFALSAIHPDEHVRSLKQLSSQLRSLNSSYILFRDYGMHDMTMYRHKTRYCDNLYCRSDGTLAYYFDIEYLSKIASEANLECVENEYHTVIVSNRKSSGKSKSMKRVFIHAVLKTI